MRSLKRSASESRRILSLRISGSRHTSPAPSIQSFSGADNASKVKDGVATRAAAFALQGAFLVSGSGPGRSRSATRDVPKRSVAPKRSPRRIREFSSAHFSLDRLRDFDFDFKRTKVRELVEGASIIASICLRYTVNNMTIEGFVSMNDPSIIRHLFSIRVIF